MEHLIRPHLRQASKSANLKLNEEVKSLQKAGHEIYHLAFGQSPFPIPDCFVNGLKEFADKNEYLPVAGTLELRQAIVDFHLKFDDGFDVDPDQIIVGTGSKELIFLVMLIFEGDLILVSPGWTTYAPQAKLAGYSPHIVKTSFDTEWKVTPTMLEDLAANNELKENKLMILNNPGNPSGTVYTLEELEKLSETCRQLKITVLSDEIYGQLIFKGQHQVLAKIYPEGTLTTAGFSKWCSAGGWRVGYIIFPKAMEAMTAVLQSAASQTYSCAPAPMQYALAKGLQNVVELETYIKQERQILKSVGDYCASELKSVGVKSIASEGGYYFMPDFEICRESFAKRGIHTGKQMCEVILKEAQVALLPGSDFLRDVDELTVRLCFVDFDGKLAMQMLNKGTYECNKEYVEACAPKVAEGIKRLKRFVQKHTT